MKNKKTAIIIVNWNGEKLLKNCLNSVFKQTYKNFDVYFVDNGSVDNSIKYVKNNFSKARILQLDKNYGFAKGNNEGIKEAFKDKKVEFIVCLNNDTIVEKNWLKELVKTAEKDEEIGMVSSKAFFTSGEIQNAGLSLEKGFGINRDGGISIGYGEKDKNINLKKDKEIFAPGGVAPLYKKKMLEEIYKRDYEWFDEKFFAYAEDLDLGFRGRLLGWKAFLSSNAKLIHLHSMTGGNASELKAFYTVRNSFLCAFKNFPVSMLLPFIYYNTKTKFNFLKKENKSVQTLKNKIGKIRLFWLLLKIYWSIITSIPKFVIKRWKIQSTKKVSNKEIKKWFRKFNRDVIENE